MNLYKKAPKLFGELSQLFMTIEEMAELTKELSKFYRNKNNYKQIAEEIADVEIMISQLKYIFNNHKEVATIKKDKLKRLKHLINSYENKRVLNDGS